MAQKKGPLIFLILFLSCMDSSKNRRVGVAHCSHRPALTLAEVPVIAHGQKFSCAYAKTVISRLGGLLRENL